MRKLLIKHGRAMCLFLSGMVWGSLLIQLVQLKWPPPARRDCIHAGQIRYHNGKACIVERIHIDPQTSFLVIDESLLEQL